MKDNKNVRGRRRRRRRGKRKSSWFSRLKGWQRALLITAVVLLCLLLAAAGVAAMYLISKWDKVDTQEIKAEDIMINQEVKERFESLDLGEGYTNIALFGVDSREGELGEGTRTDCIIVASLNNETKEIRMASVYRDTLLDLSEGTYQKCNAAYSYGGPALAISMLNMNLDLNIEDYVTVDFGAIADAIDLLGGIEIDLTDEEAMYMNEHILGTGLAAGKEVHYMEHGGLQLLDGVQATTYARIRSTAGGDFTRTERQRLVIEKVMEKAQQMDFGTLNEIIDKVFPQISTSFTLAEILNYAKGYTEYVLADSTGFPYEDALYMDLLPDIGSVVIPSDLVTNVSRLHEFLFGTTGYVPSSTVNTVSNNIAYTASYSGGTDTTGYTEDTTDYTDYTDSGYTDGAGNGYTDGTGGGYTDGTTGGYDDSYADGGGTGDGGGVPDGTQDGYSGGY